MPSVVQICNMALSHIGADARVASIDPPDGSVESGYCATFYDAARTEMLEPGNWSFSLKRAQLAQTANPSTTWAFAYALPSDCQRALRILRPTLNFTVFNQDALPLQPDDRNTAPFDIEAGVLYTNQPEAVLTYVKDVTDPTKFTASFASALSYLLASYLAGPIIKGNEGIQVGDGMRKRAMSIAAVAATADANASSATDTPQPSILAVRT